MDSHSVHMFTFFNSVSHSFTGREEFSRQTSKTSQSLVFVRHIRYITTHGWPNHNFFSILTNWSVNKSQHDISSKEIYTRKDTFLLVYHQYTINI